MAKQITIPGTVRFPFGYVIRIAQVTSAEIGIATHDTDPAHAAWSVDDMTIYLDKNRPIRQRRADFAHELGHAFLDWQAWLLGDTMADSKG